MKNNNKEIATFILLTLLNGFIRRHKKELQRHRRDRKYSGEFIYDVLHLSEEGMTPKEMVKLLGLNEWQILYWLRNFTM